MFYEPTEPVETSVIVPSTFPMFFGIAAAAYEGIGLVIPIQQSMAEPEKYSRILVCLAATMLEYLSNGCTRTYQ